MFCSETLGSGWEALTSVDAAGGAGLVLHTEALTRATEEAASAASASAAGDGLLLCSKTLSCA